MRSISDYLESTDEIGLVGWGQSNRRPWGDRETEALLTAPHLNLREAGKDLTIESIVAAGFAGTHGAVGTFSVVSVSESFVQENDWKNGELRLVQADWGDSVHSTLRRGHARVFASTILLANSTAVSLRINPAETNLIWPSHGIPAGARAVFSSTGALPAALVAGKHYYLYNVSADSLAVLDGQPGIAPALSLAGATGVLSITVMPTLTVEWLSEFQAPNAAVTFSIGTPGVVNHAGHGLTAGSTVSFTVNLPAALTTGVHYYVVNPTADTYNVSATLGGAAIAFAGAGGTTTANPHVLAFVSGYVHLNDRFNSYDNLLVVAPYQPIEPGDYPAGTPVVPGFTLAADVTSYADAGLVLPFTHREGVDGYGLAGTGTVAALVLTLTSIVPLDDKLYADGFIRVGNAKGRVVSNTTTTVTVAAWIPSSPGAGPHNFVVHLPHWRNNPHHYTAGEGFLYPLDDMQPGGSIGSLNVTGITYSRPRGRLVGSYVATVPAFPKVNPGINPTTNNPARCLTNTLNQMTVALNGSTLVVSWVPAANNHATEQIQFEHFLRSGYTVLLLGFGQNQSVDGFWRITRMDHAKTGSGSIITLTPLNPNTNPLPTMVAGDVPIGASVTRLIQKPAFKFGSILESCWRMSLAFGRRIVAMHLGINSSSMFEMFSNAGYGFQGKLGWFDDDLHFCWTPADPDSLAARLKRVVDFIAPRALATSLGADKKLKVVMMDAWQLETDALFTAGRDSAREAVPTFVSWIRNVVTAAGLSPYPVGAKIPVQWAQLTAIPWEQGFLAANPLSFPATTGDIEGKVNAALTRFVALDGFAASIDTDGAAKGPDNAHFNGFGQVTNGKAVAEALIPLVKFAFSFDIGPGAVSVANEALNLLGSKPNVTSLDPPNNTAEARACADQMVAAREWTLQQHQWTFATRRVAAVAVDDAVSTFTYAYAVPPDLLKPTKLLAPDASDDVQEQSKPANVFNTVLVPDTLEPTTQKFQIESDRDGNRILRTDLESAQIVYIARNVPFEAWDPMARQACVYKLAHLISGSTMKGTTGATMGQSMLSAAIALVRQAAADNAEFHTDVRPQVKVRWLP